MTDGWQTSHFTPKHRPPVSCSGLPRIDALFDRPAPVDADYLPQDDMHEPYT
jgi:hypothetical protein